MYFQDALSEGGNLCSCMRKADLLQEYVVEEVVLLLFGLVLAVSQSASDIYFIITAVGESYGVLHGHYI